MSRLVPGTSLGSSLGLLPRHLPRHLPRRCLGRCLGSCSRQLPRPFPDTYPRRCLGRWFGTSWSRFLGNLLQDVPNRSRTSKPPIPGNRWFGRVWDGPGSPRGPIPYSIYISQFQTGTPKPRYIGFRAGVRENGTRNGQFRPVFGHILWPLSDPSLFHEIRALERPRAWFPRDPGKPRKVSFQTPPGRGSWDRVWRQSGGASQELLQTGVWEGVWEAVWEAVWNSFPGAAPDCHQTATRPVPWFGVCHQTRPTWRKSVLPRSQAGC